MRSGRAGCAAIAAPAGAATVGGDNHTNEIERSQRWPNTPENWILCRPLHQLDALDAVISREGKSPSLIAHIVSNLSEASQFRTLADMEDHLLVLLADPAINEENIHAIAQLNAHLSLSSRILSKICAHPLAGRRTVIDTIWRSAYSTAEQVAATTGLLLIAAVNWVSRHADRDGPNRRLWHVDDETEAQILTTTDTWTTWAGTNSGRAAFLAANSHAFTCEGEMFSVGAALTGAPTAT